MMSHMGNPRHSVPTSTNRYLVLVALICLCLAVIVLGALGLLTTELIDLFIKVLRVVLAL